MGSDQAGRRPAESRQAQVCVIGAGTRFLSGISYYTLRLANALARSHQVSVILMRRLLPAFLYPGRKRVGAKLTQLEFAPAVQVFDGVDWFWMPSLVRALLFLLRRRPSIVVFQWWTGTVLHTYLLLALASRLLGARVIVEFHEVLDTGEAKLPLAQAYVAQFLPVLLRLAEGFVVHSEYDRRILDERYGLRGRPVALIPLGSFDHYQNASVRAYRPAPSSCCNLLFFGVIRPFKGLEDLITAFNSIPQEEAGGYWLTIVGETWEGWTLPSDLVARSRYWERITFVNRYVRDEEVAAYFAGADAVVLPYHRSSASGPLHVAMSYGLPVVVTRVGGLTEAVADYKGAILVPPKDPAALRRALTEVAGMWGKRFSDPHSWERTLARYEALFAVLKPRHESQKTEAIGW
ncbi:MAG: glycosyltransferase family 4 protein [Chloroflexi bacterium]|nr:glycosyltransferase family 4 protein [Chloroflexota bacterium]MCL5025996.1 glycosyltransferase family 4 protein [Chloroflexota bacterium]